MTVELELVNDSNPHSEYHQPSYNIYDIVLRHRLKLFFQGKVVFAIFRFVKNYFLRDFWNRRKPKKMKKIPMFAFKFAGRIPERSGGQ